MTIDAPITIEVFSDYQCPQCKVFYLDTARQLMQSYIPSGKVYYVHRDFPLSMHSHSHDAALWLNAAAAAGDFQEAESVLYTKQDTWGASGNIEQALGRLEQHLAHIRENLRTQQLREEFEKANRFELKPEK